jgi:hypothetical protein
MWERQREAEEARARLAQALEESEEEKVDILPDPVPAK